LRTRGQLALLVLTEILTQQLQELLRVLSDHLGNLRVTSCDLLQDGLEHVGLLLDKLSELLEVGVAAQEVQVTQSLTSTTASAATTLAGLGSGFKHVETTVFTSTGKRGSGSGIDIAVGRGGGTCLLLLLRLLRGLFGDTLANVSKKICDRLRENLQSGDIQSHGPG
jgi:hypothetical protein